MDIEDNSGAEAHEASVANSLSNMGVGELLAKAHEALIRDLAVRVIAGTATKEDKAQLRQMLKDNGMVWAGVTHPDPHAGPKRAEPQELPELEDPDYE